VKKKKIAGASKGDDEQILPIRMETGKLRTNRCALAKSAAYLQSIIQFLAQPEIVHVKDD